MVSRFRETPKKWQFISGMGGNFAPEYAQTAEGGYMPLMYDRFGNYLVVSFDNDLCYTRAFRRANGMA